MKILLDSSVWIEYFSGGPKSKGIEKYFKASHEIVLPSIVAYEVYKKIKSAKGERMAVLVLAQMERFACAMVSLDQGAAIAAADLSLQYKIPMADAIILAMAISSKSTIITMDAHFKDLPQSLLI